MTGKDVWFEGDFMILFHYLSVLSWITLRVRLAEGKREKEIPDNFWIEEYRKIVRHFHIFKILYSYYERLFFRENIKTLYCNRILSGPEGRRIIYAKEQT